MASPHLAKLKQRLQEVDEIIAARDAICPSNAGRPAKKQGAAVISGGTVLLAALLEGYLEELFEDCLDTLYSNIPTNERNNLKNRTSRRNNSANPNQVNTPFFYLGVPWVMQSDRLRWRKMSNRDVRERLQALSKARNQLAHGGSRSVRKQTLVSWRRFVERLAERLDEIAANHIAAELGLRPW